MYQNQKQKFITSKKQLPLICLKNLDTSMIDTGCLVEGFCDCISIPMISQQDEAVVYDQIFDALVLKYIKQNGKDDTLPIQSKILNLIVDDNDGERKYYISSMIDIQDDESVCEQLAISLTIQEEAIVELALLKNTDHEQFVRKYSRCRVSNIDGIKNRLGFVMDEIDEQDLYKSIWISPDYKTIAICCIPNVHDESSKPQLIERGA